MRYASATHRSRSPASDANARIGMRDRRVNTRVAPMDDVCVLRNRDQSGVQVFFNLVMHNVEV